MFRVMSFQPPISHAELQIDMLCQKEKFDVAVEMVAFEIFPKKLHSLVINHNNCHKNGLCFSWQYAALA